MYNILTSPKNLSDLFVMKDHFLVSGGNKLLFALLSYNYDHIEWMMKRTGVDSTISENIFVWVDPITRSMHWYLSH